MSRLEEIRERLVEIPLGPWPGVRLPTIYAVSSDEINWLLARVERLEKAAGQMKARHHDTCWWYSSRATFDARDESCDCGLAAFEKILYEKDADQ